MLRRAALLYLALLAASHAVRLAVPAAPPPAAHATVLANGARMAWRSWSSPGAAADAIPFVLLHGSPGSSRDFRTLGPALARRAPARAPDLPGFGASARSVEDYSVHAHAHDSLQWMDALGIQRAHFVGFSMGGGVALITAALAPGRVASLTLISSIGAQEYELLGSYRLNHSLHELQFGFLWLLREALPHFGALDGGFFGVEYARNFLDTDQRPLRGILQDLQLPVLILHGADDFLVPVAAAREHQRLVSGSRLEVLERSHFFVFGEGRLVAERIFAFLDGGPAQPGPPPAAPGPYLSFAGQAVLTAGASLLHQHTSPFLAGAGLRSGRLQWLPVLLGAAAGTCAGFWLFYLLGRAAARAFQRLRPLRQRYETRLLPLLGVARVVPYAWPAAALIAGLLALPARRLLRPTLLISCAWSVLAVAAGRLFG